MTAPPNEPKIPSPPRAALLVAAYNAAEILPRCIESLLLQQPDQVVVVNDGSTDGTKEVLESYPTVTSIHLDKNAGVGNARNRALEAVVEEVDFIGFIDSDIVLEPGWLDTLLSDVDWRAYSVACGRVFAANDGEHWAATLDEAVTKKAFGSDARKLDPPWREVMYFNYLFKAEVIRKTGEFDSRFRTNAEDSDYFYRCAEKGFRFFYQPKARGRHCYPNPTFFGWLRRAYRNGYYTLQFHRKNRTPLLAQKKLKSNLVVLAPILLAGICFAMKSFWPLGILGCLLLFAGGMQGQRLGWRPWFGGWARLFGSLAKGIGEITGWAAKDQ